MRGELTVTVHLTKCDHTVQDARACVHIRYAQPLGIVRIADDMLSCASVMQLR